VWPAPIWSGKAVVNLALCLDEPEVDIIRVDGASPGMVPHMLAYGLEEVRIAVDRLEGQGQRFVVPFTSSWREGSTNASREAGSSSSPTGR
jgi:hypothetical protein